MGQSLVSKLKKKQEDLGLTDSEMSQLLGCSRQLWQMTRTGRTPLGRKILTGIVPAFPELQKDTIYFLSNSANNLPPKAKDNPFKRLLSRIRK